MSGGTLLYDIMVVLPRWASEYNVEQWHRLPLGHGAAEYQTLREVRRLRLEYDEAMGLASVFPVVLDRVSVSLWLYLPPGNEGLAERLEAQPCPVPDYEADPLVKLSEEYHPACLPLRVPLPVDSVREIAVGELDFPKVGPDRVG